MAVVDKYVNTDTEAEKLITAALVSGAKTICMVQTFEIAADDDDGSVYRLFKNVPEKLIPTKIELYNDAMALASSYDLGLYESTVGGVDGTVIDKDVFLVAEDITAGNGRGSPVNGLTAVDIANVLSTIADHAGDTTPDDITSKGYDIALTANTVGTAAGTISVVAWFVQG